MNQSYLVIFLLLFPFSPLLNSDFYSVQHTFYP